MAYNNNQNESALPTPGDKKRTSVDFLPKFFRSEANRKFLQYAGSNDPTRSS